MPDEFTTNYGFVKPADESPMNDFDTYLNDNWDKIMDIPSAPNITGALPQAGNYELGDRVYRTNDQSIYLLIVKDPDWGWFWRPVHAPISPWITVDALPIFANAAWSNPASSNLAIAHDNRGLCHWRGFLQRTAPIPHNTTEGVFKDLPLGLYPSRSSSFSLSPTVAAVTASGFGMMQFVRFFLGGNDRQSTAPGDNNIRLFNGDSAATQPSNLFFNFSYQVGASYFGTF